MQSAKDNTVQIIGGGMLGLLVAFLAVSHGYRVRVFCVENPLIPDADSQRNHAWLQSSLFYLSKIPKAIRWQMRQSGIRLFETFGVPPPAHRGIFGMKDEAEAEQLSTAATDIGLSSKVVTRINNEEAQGLLGEFHTVGQPYFWVPDAPFDEGRIMAIARAQALKLGAEFIDSERPVTLQLSESSPCGVVVEANGQLTASQVLILAAGSRTKLLLNQIKVDRNIRVFQSPLLVTPGTASLQVPLFVDRRIALTVVRHLPYENRLKGCLVIGNDNRIEIDPLSVGLKREIGEKQKSSIINLLPHGLRHQIVANMAARYTAGHKTEFYREGIGCTVEPWIEHITSFPGLFVSIPGKATMALVTAEKILNQVDDFLGGSNLTSTSHPRVVSPPDHIVPVYLHHEDRFNNMNDGRQEV